MESKRKSKSNAEAKKKKKSCEVVTLNAELNILGKLCGSMNSKAVGLTSSYYILKTNFQFLL